MSMVKGFLEGGIASIVAGCSTHPLDLIKVRMQLNPGASSLNPISVGATILRREGPSALFSGVSARPSTPAREEGAAGLWRGSGLTVTRAMLVTASQLATYDQVKEAILGRDGLGTHVAASLVAGFVAAAASNPVDVIKTRIMNMKKEEAPYKGAVDCALKTVRAEGPMALYKGFVPTVCRQGPFTVILFVTLEQVRKLTRSNDNN